MDLFVSLILLVLILAIVGFFLQMIVTHVPMIAPFQQVITVIVVVFIVLYLLAVLTGRATLPVLHLPI